MDEIQRIRPRIAAQHGNDPKRLVEHYMEYQKQFADRLVPPPERTAEVPRANGRRKA